jgi:dTDP-4-amino-4,6-dideoxygalactose transaminase
VKKFEEAFASSHGATEAVAVNSCTSGLHLCLSAMGIGPGDNVLVPSLTFVATANAVLYVGATPVFVDIEDIESPNMSIADAKSKYTSNLKAIIVVHYAGYVVDLTPWRKFADKYNLMLIEDAAHAAGMKNIGSLSDAAVFSFFSNKNMTTAEGGMVIGKDHVVMERIRSQRSHGMTTGTLDRQKGHAYSYDVITLGYNYRMDEMRAAVGLVQLPRLQHWNRLRIKIKNLYRQYLSVYISEIIVPFSENHLTAAHIMPILLPDFVNRKDLMHHMREKGIQTSIHYPPIHLFSYYSNRFPNIRLERTEEFCSRELTLPLHPMLKEKDVVRVVKSLRKYIF